MKKVLWLMLLLTSMTAMAQKRDVTKFLGIPVDGYKAEMKQKLIAKGFTYKAQNDYFEGEFNGRDVIVSIATNNNKVWRIMVKDATPSSETDIKIRFNNLCAQFAKNDKKYTPVTLGEQGYMIPEGEDISYEMTVHNKRYEAAYFQALDAECIDTLAAQQQLKTILLQKYTQEELDNPTEKLQEEIQNTIEKESLILAIEMLEKNSVWFLISEQNGKYYIVMYYDNEYNMANGEDL